MNLQTLGLRHVALNVKDPQKTKEFYIRVLKMTLEWEPDPDNVYLASKDTQNRTVDNLAIHKTIEAISQNGQALDHLGFMLPTLESVDQWYTWIQSHKDALIVKEIKTHRDGARSFYFKDPDQTIIQMIFHPPVSAA